MMSKEKVIQQTKATALNAIRKIYHPKYKGLNSFDINESYADQRDYMVKSIIEKLEEDLIKLKK